MKCISNENTVIVTTSVTLVIRSPSFDNEAHNILGHVIF
jgi:hypothetical protein